MKAIITAMAGLGLVACTPTGDLDPNQVMEALELVREAHDTIEYVTEDK